MGECGEYEIGRCEIDIVGTDERYLVHALMGAHAERGAALRVGGGKREREVRMSGDEATQLTSGVPAGAEDPDTDRLYFMHNECIISHSGDVNFDGRTGRSLSRDSSELPVSSCQWPVI